jgi:hypothetical protein
MIFIFLHALLGMMVFSCGLLLALFYATPGLGYNRYSGSIECVCYVIAMTGPHYTFMLHILSGLLTLSVAGKISHLKEVNKQTNALILITIFHICFTGLLSFDLLKNQKIHVRFFYILFITSLLFSWCILDWGNEWHKAGILMYSIASSAMVVVSVILIYFSDETDASLDFVCYLELVFVVAMVFMFSMYVFF